MRACLHHVYLVIVLVTGCQPVGHSPTPQPATASPRAVSVATQSVADAVAGSRASAPPPADSPGAADLSAESWSEVEQLLDSSPGRFGVAVDVLGTAESFRYREAAVFRSASVYKVLVAAAVLHYVERGALGLDQELTIGEADAAEDEPLGGVHPSERLTVRQALDAMMRVSSNAAAHALMRILGRDRVDGAVAAWGLTGTRIPAAEDPVGPVTTAADMTQFFRALATGSLLSEGSQAELLPLLRLPEELDAVAYSLPDDVAVYTKIGELSDASNVAGWIVTGHGPVVLAIFSEGTDPGSARLVIAQLVRALYARFPT